MVSFAVQVVSILGEDVNQTVVVVVLAFRKTVSKTQNKVLEIWKVYQNKTKNLLTDWQFQVSWMILRMMLIDPSSFWLDEHQL